MRANVFARTLGAVVAGLGAIALATPAAGIASIDLTGSWTLFIDGTPRPATISQDPLGNLTITLLDDGLTLEGDITPFAGEFSVDAFASLDCTVLSGRASIDSNSIEGEAQLADVACCPCLPVGFCGEIRSCTCTCLNPVTKPLRGCRTDGGATCCGDGIVDPTEQCDDGPVAGVPCCNPTCQFAWPSFVCRASAGQCDSAETCPGNSDVCPADAPAVAGTPCLSDGNLCTTDACNGNGFCVHPPGPAGTPCSDDGNLCTGDTCNGSGACVHPPQIDTSCALPTASAAAKIRIANRETPDGDSLAFRWKKGPETPTDAFGDPTASTDYALCVYDETAGPGSATLKLRADVPAGGTCGGAPCWDATGKGFTYYNPDATPDGLKRLRLVAREDGKAKIAAAGRGPNLTLSPSAYAPKITVQLKASNGGCWGASFSTPSTNSDGKLRAKSD